ncbi:MAG: acetylornithine transaminase [Rhizobiales bacterium 62-17]|nr:aspartate aminotransferase family protein [Hyphomicrobiales bacterium]OJY00416.1 MAG: acetylornithine transaminase [Rhizobiales bacterium 62-17]
MADPVHVSSDAESAILPTYIRADVAFERGEGAWLTATDGSRWLDFGAGIAVAGLGHSHPHVLNALKEQGEKLWHVSNLYKIPQAEKLAHRLADATFADYVFFTNSGAEALEGAIKTARKYQFVSGHPERVEIITFDNAFHGRTLATIAAGGNDKYVEGFAAPVEGFHRKVRFGDIEAVKAAIGPRTAAIMVEPIQGEGGIRVPPASFLRDLRKLCDEHGLLLVLDEVQSGMGRTGKLFSYMSSGIEPDVMAVAKGIGCGFPLGAFLTTKEAGKGMVAGTHGTTYGGNPLATAVGNAVLDVMLAPGFLEEVGRKGLLMKQKLAALKDAHPRVIKGIRGEGLMLGIQLDDAITSGDFTVAVRDQHMLVVPAAENVARLLPPLTIGETEMNEAITRLEAACKSIEAKLPALQSA